ncbi:MAG: SIS domain-containing protein [Alphaproteobacteria bacterium]|jgi:D-sedoheptulose 7-phosphate isomerase|nr:SIS domain-containing protein [Alphaproteobacteria bacterium]MDP6564722.1 SIS domain-containing protein [Alphaproteobacteria bacterium]MDP6815016.1 SIS domain-containing protein [Alphaproteobacteria bacterium]
MRFKVDDYFAELGALPLRSLATDGAGHELPMAALFESLVDLLRVLRDGGGKLMIVGNGGSATIASHMAEDFSKNGGVPTLAFNDGAMLSALANDEGYEQVFARQIEFFGAAGDLLIAISSSGNSANIVNAVAAARDRGCGVLTMSGFGPDNQLRRLGDFNIYVPSGEYGFVEVVHLALVHALLDIFMGWSRQEGLWSRPEAEKGAA